jgi:predicted RNA binding protein YcfA (HicA-like mRNA interferase family)
MPSPIRFAVIRKELEAAGYVLVRISGSHHISSG